MGLKTGDPVSGQHVKPHLIPLKKSRTMLSLMIPPNTREKETSYRNVLLKIFNVAAKVCRETYTK